MKKGIVYLVGAGPGDPGLLTVKAKECINQCDALVYDHLVSGEIIDEVPKGTELLFVGKYGGGEHFPQRDINRLLIEKAGEGKKVVRLKGGDPFVFGRGGEELEVLKRNGIGFEVVPGVSSATGAPAYAGIPLTHRAYSSSLTIVTGHEDIHKKGSAVNWEGLASTGGTLVFLMGVRTMAAIAGNLIKNGLDPDTPAAAIRWGTFPEQHVVVSTIEKIPGKCKERGFKPPAVIVIGGVVKLREGLKWFERKPLSGKRVISTRSAEQIKELSRLLWDAGARPLEFPLIQVVPQLPTKSCERIIRRFANVRGKNHFHWIVFTSANGVKAFFSFLRKEGGDGRSLYPSRIAAIGTETTKALRKWGIEPDLIPQEYTSLSMGKALKKRGIRDKDILLPRSAIADKTLPDMLKKAGARIRIMDIYNVIPLYEHADRLREIVFERKADVITFFSPSTVDIFAEIFKGYDIVPPLKDITVASVGPVTANRLIRHGISPDIIPDRYTAYDLVQAMEGYLKCRTS